MALWDDLASKAEEMYNSASQTVGNAVDQSNKWVGDKIDQSNQVLNNIISPAPQPAEKGWADRIADNLVDIVSNMHEGAKQGLQESQNARAQENALYNNGYTPGGLSNITPIAGGGNNDMTVTNNGITPSQQDVADTKDYANKASSDVTNETILPAMMATPLAIPAVATMLAKTAADTYQNTEGTPLEKTGNAIRSDWYGPAVDMYNDPKLEQNFYDKPVSTFGNAAMAGVQALLPLAPFARKFVKGTTDLVKSGETAGRDMLTEQPVDNISLIPKERDLVTDDPTTGVTRLKTPEERAADQAPAQSENSSPTPNLTPIQNNDNKTKEPWQMTSDEFNNHPDFHSRWSAEGYQNTANTRGGTWFLHDKDDGGYKNNGSSVTGGPIDSSRIGKLNKPLYIDYPGIDEFTHIEDFVKKNFPDEFEKIDNDYEGWSQHTSKVDKVYSDWLKSQGYDGAIFHQAVAPENRTTVFALDADNFGKTRKELIERALQEGKPVPAEVLKEYPDLQPPKPLHQELVDAVESKLKQTEHDPYANDTKPISDTEIGKQLDPYAVDQPDQNPYGNAEKPLHQELVDKVEEQMKPSKNIAKNFYEQSLKPIIEGATESAKDLKDSISPASVSDHSRDVADTIRQHNSENKLAYMQVEKDLNEAQKHFSKMSTEQQKQSLIDYQEGNITDPKVKSLTDAMKNATGNTWLDLVDMGKDKAFEEWFLPQQWAKSKNNGEILRKWNDNPLGAPTGWLNKKVVPSYREGIRLGLEPANTNPVDAILTRETQARRWIMAEKIKAELESSKEIEFIKPGEAIPETDGMKWKAIKGEDNPLGPNSKGVYFARPESARVINNFLGEGWQKANLYKAWMAIANTMNQFQLLGGFHLGFTSIDTLVSKATLIPKLMEDSIGNMRKGNYKLAAGNIADAMVKGAEYSILPYTPIKTGYQGRNLIKDLLNKDKQNDPLIRAWKAGGGKIGLPEEFTTQWSKSMKKSWANNDIISAGLKTPFYLAEKFSGMITDKVVPWQKAGVFKELMGYELKKNPDLINNQKLLMTTAGRVMDTIDNRLGQVNWDNLFLNPEFKQFLFATTRAPGWAGGTVREIGGGVLDAINTKKRLSQGDSLITHRMAYDMALPITSLIVNGVTQMLLTGQQPDWSKEWKSLMFKYDSGTKGSLGQTNYSTSPSYMKELNSYYNSPTETATNKLHPLLSLISQLYKNKDYFNTQITNPDDNIVDKTIDRAKYAFKSMEPFGVSGAMKLRDQDASLTQQLMSGVGFNPAPSSLTMTDAQKKITEVMSKMEITKTPDEADKSKMISQTRRDLQSGKITQNDIVKMARSGQLTEEKAKEILKDKDVPGIARSIASFPMDDAIKVYDVATPKEKEQMKAEIIKKLDNAFHNKNTSNEDKQRYYEYFKKIR